jgi:hypothetical protein
MAKRKAAKGDRDRDRELGERAEGPTIRVRAIKTGFYGDVRRRIGDVFDLYPRRGTFSELEVDKDDKPVLDDSGPLKTRIFNEVQDKVLTAEEQFSDTWMVRVSDDTPEKRRTAQEEIDAEHDAILAARQASQASGEQSAKPVRPSGDNDVLSGDSNRARD